MILQPPTTKEDFEAIRQTIIDLINNPYADKSMLASLKVKLTNVENKIKTL